MTGTHPTPTELLASLLALSERASPGPWKAWQKNGHLHSSSRMHLFDGANRMLSAITGSMKKNDEYLANAALIAAAVNFIRDHGAELLTTLSAREDGWQAIETAPIDGTEILISGIAWGGNRPDEPRYVTTGLFHEFEWRENEFSAEALYEPTHWQPLPEPPKAPTAGEGK